ncbi:MAG TPA: SDR family NAD(P)-dependent oxidoreductase, partial [Pseudorhizobium sp.]|nr:SDR family NAD(P)-dependent oxidoreductase [Pseudorhizobium sp.]
MHVIITGGSSGIGLAIARIYAGRGDQVTVLARDLDRLEGARSELLSIASSAAHIQAIAADVSVADTVLSAVSQAESVLGPCDLLIASAGIVEPGRFDELEPHHFDEQIRVNLTGAANAVRAVYPAMRKRGSGRIMIVSSGAALIGLPGYTAYCASKSGLGAFVEALSEEAMGSGVTIGICYPPDTDTPQLQRELLTRPADAQMLIGHIKPWPAQAVAEKIV